jgi:GxxExxY protein
LTANQVARQIVDSAFRVHVTLGPGLLESVYVAVLSNELSKRGLQVATQQAVPLVYEGLDLQISFRADMIVQEKVIVEVKSVEAIALVHKMQLLTYLRLADKRLGLLINFNVTLIKDGITRVVNGLTDSD